MNRFLKTGCTILYLRVTCCKHWCKHDLAEIFAVVLWEAGHTCEACLPVSGPCIIFFFPIFVDLRFENVVYNFHLYFHFWTPQFLVEEEFYSFCNWFYGQDWCCWEQVIGRTIYLGLTIMSAAIYQALCLILIIINIQKFYMSPAFFFSFLSFSFLFFFLFLHNHHQVLPL